MPHRCMDTIWMQIYDAAAPVDEPRGAGRYVGRHRFEEGYNANVDPRRKRAFFRLADRLYRRALLRCEVERAAAGMGSAADSAAFKVAVRGGLCYAPGQLTLEWQDYAEPEDVECLSEFESCYQGFALKDSIPYEEFLASELVLMYTALHEGIEHVSIEH
jgi:hypothetical protein